jgi:predicted dehydrogenase
LPAQVHLRSRSEKLARSSQQLPGTNATSDFEAVLDDHEVQAVVIATPGPTHYALCKRALERGKDVYVEKPFVLQWNTPKISSKSPTDNGAY